MKFENKNYLEDVILEIKNKGVILDIKNRLYFSSDGKNLLKYHLLDNLDRVNRALSLQEFAYRNNFPCSYPVKNGQGLFACEYNGGFLTADRVIPGESLNPRGLWSEEVSSFVKKFYEFQRGHNIPTIIHQKKSLKNLINNCQENICFSREYLNIIKNFSFSYLKNKGGTIIHGDILPKNIRRGVDGRLFLIDFEKVMLGSIEDELASSILYSHIGTGIDLVNVYENFCKSAQQNLSFNPTVLLFSIFHKSAVYMIQKNIDYSLGHTKKREIEKAERFFVNTINLLEKKS